MSRTIKTWLFLLSLSLTIFGCEKEYSLENGGLPGGGGAQSGTARFTFEGAPGGCTTPSVLGTYKAGTPLTAAEKVTLIVNVTEAGTYTISTATFNGISFSGSGTFTATGQQFIELTAVGSTPATAGTFSYIPGTAGCSFSIQYAVSSGSQTGTAVYTLKGAPDDCTDPVIAGTFVAGTPLTSASSITLTAVVTTLGTYTISTGTANGVKFSGSGTFTAMGEQPIVLTSTDTPTSAGTDIAYTPGANGCSFTIDYTGGSTGTDYLRCKIAGASEVTTFNTDLSATNTSGGGASDLEFSGNSATGGLFSIDLLAMGAITTGDYKLPSLAPTKANITTYNDGTENWSGAITPGQGTFTVNIATLTANRATGTFSGTLYGGSGQGPTTLVITGGEFSVGF